MGNEFIDRLQKENRQLKKENKALKEAMKLDIKQERIRCYAEGYETARILYDKG